MEFTDKNFEEEVLKANIPVLVDFWGSWCPPCKIVEPVLEKLEKKYKGRVRIGKLNVDRYPLTASKYHVKGVPTFIVFQQGIAARREVGAKSEKQLCEIINSVTKSST